MSQPRETITEWQDGKLVEREVDPIPFDAVVALQLEPISKHGPDVARRRRSQRRALWKIIADNPDIAANPAELARRMQAESAETASADYKSLEIIIRRALKRYYEKSK